MAPHTIRESSEVGGGPGGGSGQLHAQPGSEFGGTGHTHGMSPQEIGLMVGVIVLFSLVIGGLFFYRARKIKKRQVDQEAADAAAAGDGDCIRPVTRDSTEMEGKSGLRGPEASSGSFRQLFGSRWPGVKRGSNRTNDIPLARL